MIRRGLLTHTQTKCTVKSPENHYPCLDLEAIKSLEIGSIMEKDSVICMWVLSSMLPESLAVLDAWGFKYKTLVFNWVKTVNDGTKDAFGMGYYTRQNTELCLLATRGKGLKVLSHAVRQEIRTPKEAHSKKPEITRDRLIELFGPDVSKVEIFARQNAGNMLNWRLIGNEIDGKDVREALEEIARE